MRTPLKSIALAALNRQLPILFILIIGAIGVQTFTSCGRGGGDVKLLESITDDSGNVQRKFEYDKQNRLVKIYSGKDSTIITYNSDDLVTVKTSDGDKKYVRKGNTVTLDKETFIINEEGYIVKRESDGYQYQNGNLIQGGWEDPASDYLNTDYSYDDKKSPFSNCTSPKWLLQSVLSYSAASKNNVIGISYEGGSSGYEYEYDSDEFPTKETNTVYDAYEGGNESTTITRFTYRGKGGNAPAKAESGGSPGQEAQKQDGTRVIDKTSLIFIITPANQHEESDWGWYMAHTRDKFQKLGIEDTNFPGKNERYISFVIDNGENYVLDKKDITDGALLYKKGKKPITVGMDTEEWGLEDLKTAAEYLGINLSEALKRLGRECEEAQSTLEGAIVCMVKAFQNKDAEILNNLLLPGFGCAVVHLPGIACIVSVETQVSFSSEYRGPGLSLINHEGGTTDITDFKVHFGKFPDKWEKYGIYCDTTSTDGTLASIAESNKNAGFGEWTAQEIKNLKKIGNSSHRVTVIDKKRATFDFLVTSSQGKWWLSAVIRSCSGDEGYDDEGQGE